MRSLERKNDGSAELENLLDFAIFSVLSYQCDITNTQFVLVNKKNIFVDPRTF